MPPSRVRQSDIARLAGVSQTTVSLVLNGDTSVRISPETRRRVLDAIRVTGYAANPLAQGLAGGRRKIFGVFTYESAFPRDAADFYQPFLAGIEAEAEALGCDLMLFTSARVAHGRRQLFDDGWNRLRITDGCVLLGRHVHRPDLDRLRQDEFPYVFVGRRECGTGPVPYVGADYVTATAEVVRMLVDRGHRRIGFLGDLGPDESSTDRVTGYRTAMEAAGLAPLAFDHTGINPRRAVELITDNRLTAVVVGADYLAEDLRVVADEAGLTVPTDLSIAILGEPERPLAGPLAWSGFRIPREEMGRQAVRLLAGLVDGADTEPVRQQLLACPVEQGETIAAAPGGATGGPAGKRATT